MDLDDVLDSLDDLERGCTCPTGHPPCAFCCSLTEEEGDIHAKYGSAAVYEFRRGVLPAPMMQKQHYACMEEFGEF